jgi:hypothetical protein
LSRTASGRRPAAGLHHPLSQAQEQDSSDTRLQEIAAEALREVHFQDGGRCAGSLEEVRFRDIETSGLSCSSRPATAREPRTPALHGVGPKALRVFRDALAERGFSLS